MRRVNDFYPTPGVATKVLLERLRIAPGTTALECCSGAHDITRELRAGGLKVVTNDIDGNSMFALDARREESWDAFPRTAWVVTNPPFSAAAEIVRRAHGFTRAQSLGGVAMLLRLSFLEPCDDRGAWLSANPPSDVIVLPRISFTGDGRTDNVTCAWLVWRPDSGQRVKVVTKSELARLEDASPRLTVGAKPAGDLTDAQHAVVVDLRQRGCYGTAEAVAAHWKQGEHYYIDARVNIPKALRRRFDAINDKLLAAADARFEDAQKKGGE